MQFRFLEPPTVHAITGLTKMQIDIGNAAIRVAAHKRAIFQVTASRTKFNSEKL